MPFAGQTLVPTLYGKNIRIKDLPDDKFTHVFTWDGEKISVGQIKRGKTVRERAYFITLDNDMSIFCSDYDFFVTKKDGPKEVLKLKRRASIMPLYIKLDAHGYPLYADQGEYYKSGLTINDKNKRRKVCRMVAEWKYKKRLERFDWVEFVDMDRLNAHPDNIILINKPKDVTRCPAFAKPFVKAGEILQKLQARLDRFKINNHKVTDYGYDVERDLIEIEGLDTTNFGAHGVFVFTDINTTDKL